MTSAVNVSEFTQLARLIVADWPWLARPPGVGERLGAPGKGLTGRTPRATQRVLFQVSH